MKEEKKSLDSEINLVPFISLLSVLICSLLLTAVWVQLASIDVKQSVGSSGRSIEKNTEATLWANIDAKGAVMLEVKNPSRELPKRLRRSRIQVLKVGEQLSPDFATLEERLAEIKKAEPSLDVALVRPDADTLYDHVIGVMDKLKSQKINDLGVIPL